MSLETLMGSLISSYLGPCKSNKYVLDAEEVHMIKCPLQLLHKLNLKEQMAALVEETLNSHHDQYGCSTSSLLAMWYFWHKEFCAALEEGCKVRDIVEHSQNILEQIIALLPELIVQCDKTYIQEQSNGNLSQHDVHSPPSKANKSSSICKQSVKVFGSSQVPIGIRYSSRHYSPFMSNLPKDAEETMINDLKERTNSTNLMSIQIDDSLKHSIRSIIQKLNHSDYDFSRLIYDIWMKQVKSQNNMKFNIDGIIICPLTLPCSYTTVVDGLIIKSPINSLYDQELNQNREIKALIIKGSITFEYVHLGYSPAVHFTTKKSTDELKESAKDLWVKECCELLSKLHVNLILVNGEVDSSIRSFCLINSILLLHNIPWHTLEILCVSLKESPCTYLLDCDNKNVISNLSVQKWSFGYKNFESNADYFHIDITKANGLIQVCTVILCHPNNVALISQEHQFWHEAARLHLATKENKLLPGGGKTEEWCCNKLKMSTCQNYPEARIKTAISNGFEKYSEVIKNKIAMTYESKEVMDEVTSKIQAWRSSIVLGLISLQCDYVILNGCDDTTLNSINLEPATIGFL